MKLSKNIDACLKVPHAVAKLEITCVDVPAVDDRLLNLVILGFSLWSPSCISSIVSLFGKSVPSQTD